MAGRFWDNPAAARARVALCYLWGHWRLPALDNPTRFTELVQWRKLQVSDSRYPALMDKLAAKQMALDALTGVGFVLEAESDLYAQPGDPRDANVFDASIRGNTDQFAWRLRKPDAG